MRLLFGEGLSFELISTWAPDLVAALCRHYTRSSGAPPGKKLAWRIYCDREPIGWIGLGEPAFKLAPRRRLGIADARPRPHTVCDFIFRLEAFTGISAGDILRAWLAVAASDWAARYGWSPVHWETMVDPACVRSSVPGACYRRAGYRALGLTTGWGARRPPGSTHGPRVWGPTSRKLVLYRGPLARLPA
jgi:hypothetical protein